MKLPVMQLVLTVVMYLKKILLYLVLNFKKLVTDPM